VEVNAIEGFRVKLPTLIFKYMIELMTDISVVKDKND
jgi:hypothetical protein